MSVQYIQIDSSFRDRTQFPNPADFEILTDLGSSNCSPEKFIARDPVSYAAPLLVFTPEGAAPYGFNTAGGLELNGNLADYYLTPPTNGVGDISQETDMINVVITLPVGEAQKTFGYYNELVLEVFFENVIGETTIDYDYVRRHINAWIYQKTENDLDYFLLILDRPLPDDMPDTSPTANVQATVRIANTTDITDPNNPLFYIPNGVFTNNFFIEYSIYNQDLNEFRKIIDYNGTTSMATLDGSTPISGWSTEHTYVLRKAPPCQTGTLTNGTTNSFTLPLTSSSENDFYRGDFIRITSGANENEIRRINTYDGATRTGTFSPALSVALTNMDTYEILKFTKDNWNPLNYTGSTVSLQEEMCYEISLLSLVVPNVQLDVGFGSRIAFYPYIFVEFSQEGSAGGASKNILYSNSPHSTKKLFAVATHDIASPLISSFIKFTGNGMSQIIKFKPNSHFKFSVSLQSGETFSTTLKDNMSPLDTNPRLQVSAIFAIRRVK